VFILDVSICIKKNGTFLSGSVQTFSENGALASTEKLDKNGKKERQMELFYENGPLNKIGSSIFGLEEAVHKSYNAIVTLDSYNYLDCYQP
jgi:antitoxin component YwqK of YwqJK toxin-antitoxin module